jgi:hypothetical protein
VNKTDREYAKKCSRYNDYRLFLISELNKCEKRYSTHCDQMKTEYEENEKFITECKKKLNKAPVFGVEHIVKSFIDLFRQK